MALQSLHKRFSVARTALIILAKEDAARCWWRAQKKKAIRCRMVTKDSPEVHHEGGGAVTTTKVFDVQAEQVEPRYDVRSLGRRYGLGRHQAERILQRFGNSKWELDLLLAARGRTPNHRPEELATSEQKAPFGIG